MVKTIGVIGAETMGSVIAQAENFPNHLPNCKKKLV
jgi:3-hydroxyacyl-CoA dehydrogenase